MNHKANLKCKLYNDASILLMKANKENSFSWSLSANLLYDNIKHVRSYNIGEIMDSALYTKCIYHLLKDNFWQQLNLLKFARTII